MIYLQNLAAFMFYTLVFLQVKKKYCQKLSQIKISFTVFKYEKITTDNIKVNNP